MNKLEIIEAVEALKIGKQYGEALKKGIRNIDEESAIEIATEMAREMLPVYEKAFPENKAPRRVLDLAVEYRKNPTELNKEKLEKAAEAASAAAWAAADASADAKAVTAAACAAAAAFYAYFAADESVCTAAIAAANAYDNDTYEQFCNKYLDKMLEILKREEKE